MRVVELKSTLVKETIDEALRHSDALQGVIILGLKKDGSQLMLTSSMSGYQKAFLFQFFQAWMTKWFRLEEGPDEAT